MNYKKEDLYNLSIYEVRKIGQLEGVKSPTSKKKDELIDEILAISSGEKDRYVPTNKKGRPSKAFKDLDFLRAFEIEDNKKPKKSFFDSSLDLCVPNLDEQAIYKMATEPDGEEEGFVDIIDQGFGLIRKNLKNNNDFVFLTSSLLKNSAVKKGDFIKVSVLKLGNGKRMANEIISAPKTTSKLEFLKLSPVYPSKVLTFKNNKILNELSPIGNGQRTLVTCKDENLLDETIFNMFNQVDISKYLILFGAQPEEKIKYQNDPQIICVSDEKELVLAQMAVNILHRKAELGEDCAMFVVGADKFGKLKEDVNLPAELTSSFKNTSQAGSVALIVGSTNEHFLNSFHIFNLKISLDENLYLYGADFPIDVNKLSLFRKDGLLSSENLEKIKQCKLANLKSKEELAFTLNNI